MSAVHYTETLILVNDRRRALLPPLQEQLQRTPIEFVSVTPTQAEIAAEARAKYPLNLGDCFAYALAKDLDLPLLTLDRDFRRTDVRLVVQPGFHRHARRPR
jgi:ribonuclease VapC